MAHAEVNNGGVTKSVDYANNPAGKRFMRVAGGVTKAWTYQGDNIASVESTTSPTLHSVYSGSGLAGVVERDDVDTAGNGSTTSRFYLYNHRGDVVGVSDGSGNLTSAYDYDAYGNVSESYNSGGGSAPTDDILFTGKDLDPDTGLYYFNARWYDSESGRFVSQTSLPPTSEGPYLLCHDDPVNDSDPSGLWSLKSLLRNLAVGVVVGAVVAAAVVMAVPVGVAGLVAIGVVAAAEAGAVTTAALTAAAVVGGALLTNDAANAAVNGDWDRVAYDVGMGIGGALVGGLTGGGGGEGGDTGVTGGGGSSCPDASAMNALRALPDGNNPNIKMVDSAGDLSDLIGALSAGGTEATPPSYQPGNMVKFPDGTRVGLRNHSKTAGNTANGNSGDVHLPDGTKIKVHIR